MCFFIAKEHVKTAFARFCCFKRKAIGYALVKNRKEIGIGQYTITKIRSNIGSYL